MLRIRFPGKWRTKGNEVSRRSQPLGNGFMLALPGNQNVLGQGNFSALIALDALVKIKTQPVFHIPTSLEHRHRMRWRGEIALVDLFHIGGYRTAGIRLSEDPPGEMQQEKNSKGNRNDRRPEQHAKPPPSHKKKYETENRRAHDAGIGERRDRG